MTTSLVLSQSQCLIVDCFSEAGWQILSVPLLVHLPPQKISFSQLWLHNQCQPSWQCHQHSGEENSAKEPHFSIKCKHLRKSIFPAKSFARFSLELQTYFSNLKTSQRLLNALKQCTPQFYYSLDLIDKSN